MVNVSSTGVNRAQPLKKPDEQQLLGQTSTTLTKPTSLAALAAQLAGPNADAASKKGVLDALRTANGTKFLLTADDQDLHAGTQVNLPSSLPLSPLDGIKPAYKAEPLIEQRVQQALQPTGQNGVRGTKLQDAKSLRTEVDNKAPAPYLTKHAAEQNAAINSLDGINSQEPVKPEEKSRFVKYVKQDSTEGQWVKDTLAKLDKSGAAGKMEYKDAVMAFQRVHKLKEDGKVGPETLRQLQKVADPLLTNDVIGQNFLRRPPASTKKAADGKVPTPSVNPEEKAASAKGEVKGTQPDAKKKGVVEKVAQAVANATGMPGIVAAQANDIAEKKAAQGGPVEAYIAGLNACQAGTASQEVKTSVAKFKKDFPDLAGKAEKLRGFDDVGQRPDFGASTNDIRLWANKANERDALRSDLGLDPKTGRAPPLPKSNVAPKDGDAKPSQAEVESYIKQATEAHKNEEAPNLAAGAMSAFEQKYPAQAKWAEDYRAAKEVPYHDSGKAIKELEKKLGIPDPIATAEKARVAKNLDEKIKNVQSEIDHNEAASKRNGHGATASFFANKAQKGEAELAELTFQRDHPDVPNLPAQLGEAHAKYQEAKAAKEAPTHWTAWSGINTPTTDADRLEYAGKMAAAVADYTKLLSQIQDPNERSALLSALHLPANLGPDANP